MKLASFICIIDISKDADDEFGAGVIVAKYDDESKVDAGPLTPPHP